MLVGGVEVVRDLDGYPMRSWLPVPTADEAVDRLPVSAKVGNRLLPPLPPPLPARWCCLEWRRPLLPLPLPLPLPPLR